VKTSLIRFESVTLGYGRSVVLEDVTFDILAGEFFGIIGPNGAGKTTLLRSILGLLRPQTGRMIADGGLRYGYVMQRQLLDTRFPFSVEEIVGMGRLSRAGVLPRSGPDDEHHVSHALEITGIAPLRNRLYRDLSGGQKQRVLLARALACEPEVLILDEPTNDMDIQGEHQIMTLLRELQQEKGVTVVLVSHLLHVVLNFTDRLTFLVDGRAHVHTLDELASGDLLSGMYGIPVEVGTSRGKRYLITGS